MHRMLTTLGALGALCVLGAAVSAQDLEGSLQEKLSKDFVQNAAWVQDFDQAKAQAAKEGKLIFGYFTRSYAP